MNDVKALFALGGKGGLRIAKALSTNEWKSASEVAEELNLHIATAVTHLSSLAEAGVAERRLRKGRRDAFEYRLLVSDVFIHLNLTETRASPVAESYIALSGFAERLSDVLGADFEALVRLLDAPSIRSLKSLRGNVRVGEKEQDALLIALVAGSVARLGRRATMGLLSAAGYDLKLITKIVGGE